MPFEKKTKCLLLSFKLIYYKLFNKNIEFFSPLSINDYTLIIYWNISSIIFYYSCKHIICLSLSLSLFEKRFIVYLLRNYMCLCVILMVTIQKHVKLRLLVNYFRNHYFDVFCSRAFSNNLHWFYRLLRKNIPLFFY